MKLHMRKKSRSSDSWGGLEQTISRVEENESNIQEGVKAN